MQTHKKQSQTRIKKNQLDTKKKLIELNCNETEL